MWPIKGGCPICLIALGLVGLFPGYPTYPGEHLKQMDDVNRLYSPGNPNPDNRLDPVDSFLYQLQDLDLPAVAATDYDLLIMDYSRDGSPAGAWSSSQIRALKQSRGGKILLAYISIGEAERYRDYWRSSWRPGRPGWLGRENPDWPGNYKVKYWDRDWQEIMLRYIDRIIDQGFDGLYLDLVDAYWYWSREAAARGEDERLESKQEAADLMIRFLEKIAGHCRNVRGRKNFILCPQNGTYLPRHASAERAAAFWAIIDAVGAEDSYHFGTAEEDNPYRPQKDVLANLDLFLARGKKVLVTEYLTRRNRKAISRFYRLSRERGFIPFATVRELNTLTINPGFDLP